MESSIGIITSPCCVWGWGEAPVAREQHRCMWGWGEAPVAGEQHRYSLLCTCVGLG